MNDLTEKSLLDDIKQKSDIELKIRKYIRSILFFILTIYGKFKIYCMTFKTYRCRHNIILKIILWVKIEIMLCNEIKEFRKLLDSKTNTQTVWDFSCYLNNMCGEWNRYKYKEWYDNGTRYKTIHDTNSTSKEPIIYVTE